MGASIEIGFRPPSRGARASRSRQVLQQLVRARVLSGVRGPRGGYRLAKERRRISVGEIIRAIHEDEPGDDAEEAESERHDDGSDLGLQIVRPMWSRIREDMMERLDAISVQDLCAQAAQAGIESEAVRKLDYTI